MASDGRASCQRGGENEGRSHYVIENKTEKNLVSGRSHYLDQNKASYHVVAHYIYEKKHG
jgi:hypothetical protein